MYLTWANLDTTLAYLLLPVWLLAAVMIGRIAPRSTTRGTRLMALIAFGLMAVAELVTAARVFTLTELSSYGWVFAADRKLFTMILIGVPATAVLYSMALLLRIARSIRTGDRKAAVEVSVRQEAASPRVLLPVQVAAFASLGGFFEKYLLPERPLATNLLVYGAVLAGVAAVLTVRVRWRARNIKQNGSLPRATAWVWIARLGTAVAITVLMSILTGFAVNTSRLPDTYTMMQGTNDFGGGPQATGRHHDQTSATSVTSLTGPQDGIPDRRFTLTAQPAQLKLSSGATVAAWTFNGQAPGPQLRMRQGELVEITLVNQLPGQQVTSHWHGVDVPNREDGVAAVTQDAVATGGSYTYRFRVDESGTRWYHSHQAGSEQVLRGLFGSMIIDPTEGSREVDQDIAIMLHDWDLDGDIDSDKDRRPAMGTADTLQRQPIPTGTLVRLRLTNTSHLTKTVSLTGTGYRISALDGTDLNTPDEVKALRLVIGAAQRVDLEFTMPANPVRLVDHDAPDAGMLFSSDGTGDLAPILDGPVFDPLSYGSPVRTEFDAANSFDRSYRIVLEEQYGFYNGQFIARMTVNGKVFPNAPMHMVRQGDLVKMRIVNRGDQDHPMHIHGHHFLVLTRNGKPPAGSPIWLDTINIAPGEVWEIGFRADNPGIWMDHCHNFEHARKGMVLHLAYENVTTPFLVGGDAKNQPQ